MKRSVERVLGLHVIPRYRYEHWANWHGGPGFTILAWRTRAVVGALLIGLVVGALLGAATVRGAAGLLVTTSTAGSLVFAPGESATAPPTAEVASGVGRRWAEPAERPTLSSTPSPSPAVVTTAAPTSGHVPVSVQRPAKRAPTWHRSEASYFGGSDGLFGQRTACGQTLTRWLVGVAHRTLPCGTRVTFKWAGHVVTAPVVDRGPAAWTGRTWDLTYRLAELLHHLYTGPVDWHL